jgi:hypothetical protein
MIDLYKSTFNNRGLTKFRVYSALFILLFIIINYTDYIKDDDDNKDCPREKIDNEVKNLIKSKERTLTKRMAEASKDGLLRGGIAGSISGGISGGISSAVIFGVLNPFILYIYEQKK